MLRKTLYKLYESSKKDKKYMVETPEGKFIHFGAFGYEDYTIHKDGERKERYIKRHQNNENWTKSGIETAGFWARWLLWNKPTLEQSLQNIENRFKIIIE